MGGVIPLQPSSPRLCHGCNHEGSSPTRAFVSPSRRTALFLSASQLLSASRVGHGMEAGQRWEKGEISPPMGSIVSRNVGGGGGE